MTPFLNIKHPISCYVPAIVAGVISRRRKVESTKTPSQYIQIRCTLYASGSPTDTPEIKNGRSHTKEHPFRRNTTEAGEAPPGLVRWPDAASEITPTSIRKCNECVVTVYVYYLLPFQEITLSDRILSRPPGNVFFPGWIQITPTQKI